MAFAYPVSSSLWLANLFTLYCAFLLIRRLLPYKFSDASSNAGAIGVSVHNVFSVWVILQVLEIFCMYREMQSIVYSTFNFERMYTVLQKMKFIDDKATIDSTKTKKKLVYFLLIYITIICRGYCLTLNFLSENKK